MAEKDGGAAGALARLRTELERMRRTLERFETALPALEGELDSARFEASRGRAEADSLGRRVEALEAELGTQRARLIPIEELHLAGEAPGEDAALRELLDRLEETPRNSDLLLALGHRRTQIRNLLMFYERVGEHLRAGAPAEPAEAPEAVAMVAEGGPPSEEFLPFPGAEAQAPDVSEVAGEPAAAEGPPEPGADIPPAGAAFPLTGEEVEARPADGAEGAPPVAAEGTDAPVAAGAAPDESGAHEDLGTTAVLPTREIRARAAELMQAGAADREAPVAVAHLVPLDGGDEATLDRDETILGRLPDCDVVVPDVHVSRRHAAIRRVEGHYTIQDLGSTNRTVVNDDPIAVPTVLLDGDVIKLGATRYVFRWAGPEAEPAPPGGAGPR
jgi:hypothetical protein